MDYEFRSLNFHGSLTSESITYYWKNIIKLKQSDFSEVYKLLWYTDILNNVEHNKKSIIFDDTDV